MFIDAKRNISALRQEGHVKGEWPDTKNHMALLTEGANARTSFYKRIAILTEGD